MLLLRIGTEQRKPDGNLLESNYLHFLVKESTMFLSRCYQLPLALCLVTVASVSLAASTQAQDRTRLAASLSGIKAHCTYEERQRDNRYKFNFQLEQAKPGTSGVVLATTSRGAITLGSFTVDSFGRGIIDIDTNEGDKVPNLDAGTVITLQYNNQAYSGTLKGR